MNGTDRAETDRLPEAIGRILPALEDFNRFQSPDLTGRERATWMAALDEPLPERGVGLQPVLQTLAETVIPYGLRIGSPGFSGWVTTAIISSSIIHCLCHIYKTFLVIWRHLSELVNHFLLFYFILRQFWQQAGFTKNNLRRNA